MGAHARFRYVSAVGCVPSARARVLPLATLSCCSVFVIVVFISFSNRCCVSSVLVVQMQMQKKWSKSMHEKYSKQPAAIDWAAYKEFFGDHPTISKLQADYESSKAVTLPEPEVRACDFVDYWVSFGGVVVEEGPFASALPPASPLEGFDRDYFNASPSEGGLDGDR